MSNANVGGLGGGHCCVCTSVCGHIGGPWYCAQHDPRLNVSPGWQPSPGTTTWPTVVPDIQKRREDAEFRERLRERMEADKRLMERIEAGPVDWRSAWSAEAAKFQAETVTTSFLATRLRDGGHQCDRCRVADGTTVLVGIGLDREWVCSDCAVTQSDRPQVAPDA